MAVLPSAETATDVPWLLEVPFVPTSLSPCCISGFGTVVIVKLPELVAVPPAVVIEIVPVEVPGMTMPTRVVPSLETTMAAVPPMVNAVGVVKLVPVMVTSVPTGPDEGLKEVIAGAVANMFPIIKTEIAKRKILCFIVIKCVTGN